jgi:hypothetical protein
MRFHMLIFLALGLSGCQADRARTCSSSSDCIKKTGDMGVCVPSPDEASSWCAYQDPSCAGVGLRWGPLAGDLADSCMEETGEQPLWSVVGGDTFDDAVYAVAIDEQGNKIVLAGTFVGALHFPGCNPISSTSGSKDVFVAVLGPLGQCGWAERYGGSGSDEAKAVAIDEMENIVVAGDFEDSINFGGDTLNSNGASDVFVAHLSGNDGSHFASRSIGDAGDDHATGLAVYGGDHIVAGYYDDSPDFGSGTPQTAYGSYDIFVAKYTGPLQTYAWARTYGNAGDDRGAAVAVDPSGNVFLTGEFRGTVNFGSDTYTAAGGSADAFVLRLDNGGNDGWALQFGGPADDAGRAIGADSLGNVIVGGAFASTIDFGSGTPLVPAGTDGFLVKLAPDSMYLWSDKLGGDANDEVHAIAVGMDTVSAVGTFQEVASFGADPLASRGAEDAFVVRVAGETGASQRSSRLGGEGSDDAHSIAVDSTGRAVVGGSFQQAVDFGTGPQTSAGMSDFFGVEYGP